VADAALSVEERLGFLDLCEARSAEDLIGDRSRVRAHLRVMDRAVEQEAVPDGHLAERITDVLDTLLVDAPSLSFLERRLLAGAVEYFINSTGVDGDYRLAHDLSDDAKVVSAVAGALGRSDLADQLVVDGESAD